MGCNFFTIISVSFLKTISFVLSHDCPEIFGEFIFLFAFYSFDDCPAFMKRSLTLGIRMIL